MRTTNTEYEQEHKQRTFNRNWKSQTQDHETVPKLSRQCWGLLLCSVLKWSFPPASSLHVSHLTLWVWLWNMWCNHSQQKHEHERGGVSVFMNHSEEKLCRVHNVIYLHPGWNERGCMSSLISKQQQVSCHHYFGSAHGNLRATELTPCINSSSLSGEPVCIFRCYWSWKKKKWGSGTYTLYLWWPGASGCAKISYESFYELLMAAWTLLQWGNPSLAGYNKIRSCL